MAKKIKSRRKKPQKTLKDSDTSFVDKLLMEMFEKRRQEQIMSDLVNGEVPGVRL